MTGRDGEWVPYQSRWQPAVAEPDDRPARDSGEGGGDPGAGPAGYSGPEGPGSPGGYRLADPLTAPGRYHAADPLTAPGRYHAADPLTAPGLYAGRRSGPDRYPAADDYRGGGAYGAGHGYGEQGYGEQGYGGAGPYAAPVVARSQPSGPVRAGDGTGGYGTAGHPEPPADDRHSEPFPGPAGYRMPEQHGRHSGRPRQRAAGSRGPQGELAGQDGYGAGLRDYPAGPHDYPAGPHDDSSAGPRDYPSGQRDYPAGQGGYPAAERYLAPGDYGAAELGPAAWADDAGRPGPRQGTGARAGEQDDELSWPAGYLRDDEPRPDSSAGIGAVWPDSGGEQRTGSLLPGLSNGDGGRAAARRPGRRRRGRFLAPLLSVIVLVALVGTGAVYAMRLYSARHQNYSGPGTSAVIVQVQPGDTATSLAPVLVRKGVIKSVDPFIAAAKASTNPTGLQPGYFRLRRHMSAALAYALLLNPGSRIQTVATVPDGLRLGQIVTDLSARTGIPAAKFTKALSNSAALGLPSYARGNAEGYLFPATYDIPPHATAAGVLQLMVAKYNQVAQSTGLAAAAHSVHLTPAGVITMASLLEAEGGNPVYYPRIARVIYNRLSAHMPLQLDSTVLYALHTTGLRLSLSQLHVKSPYNTFLHHGLPPGPIDNPGQAAIDAALHPAPGNWVYFVTVNPKTGLTEFTNSPAAFNRMQAQFCRSIGGC